MAWLPRFLVDPQIGRHLLRDEGEVIVDEVCKHWVVYVVPALIAVVGVGFLGLFLVSSVSVAWLPLVIGLGLLSWAGWRALAANMDRFVITNMRVFRVKGVLARSLATMPLGRILDITVVKPMTGRLLGYGHFTFESAAQDQGLRDIRFVGSPDARDLAIQRVVQRAGLRGAPRLSG
ncbi:PH domain-containing protein [Nocardioides pocheonensis]|uniref:PH domain-containing protein n=1 Tax=Nocardioides pocheonensis TaxID=661485 RepID=A0A3N0GHL2_9ACTN|nr:PH domain-containing protein [Nocardioides pocheonensis]RNM11520.1 PH domain-containing protein [Nocardioides pocheonensis]